MAVLFSCHDSHKHLHEMSGIGLWICCLMGGITICLNTWMDFTSTFMMLDVSYTVCVSEQDREICSFTSGAYCSLLGVPPEVFALMQ